MYKRYNFSVQQIMIEDPSYVQNMTGPLSDFVCWKNVQISIVVNCNYINIVC